MEKLLRHWSLLHSALFAGAILLLAALAGGRAVPFALPDDAGVMGGKLTHAFETHYDAVFPVKTLGTNTWAALDYLLFEEGRPGVVVGEQDWLYTQEEFRTWPDAEATIEAHLAQILDARDALARRGTKLIVALLPSKSRIYPEFVGGARQAAVHRDLYARAYQVLQAGGVLAPDLHRTMAQCRLRMPAFLRADTHWTPGGARCVAIDLSRAVYQARLGGTSSTRFTTRIEQVRPHRGDLARFLPLEPHFAWLMPPDEPVEFLVTEHPVTNPGGLLDETPQPDVVVVGTSYSADTKWNFVGSLKETLREDVVSYAVAGQGPFAPMRDFLADPPPARLVIWEIPERYLPMPDTVAPSPSA